MMRSALLSVLDTTKAKGTTMEISACTSSSLANHFALKSMRAEMTY